MLEIKKVGKKFGDKVVFTDLSYTINDGKMIAIVGPSGCGKSTLLNILGLLDTDYSGEVLYDGQLLSKASEKKRDEYIRNNINYALSNRNKNLSIKNFEKVFGYEYYEKDFEPKLFIEEISNIIKMKM